MRKKEEGWLKFEEGLSGSEFLENEFACKNDTSYNAFRKNCIDQKHAEERRAILVFWDTRFGKKKSKEESEAERLLIESIMNSCTPSEDSQDTFLTVAMVKCEDPMIKDVAFVKGKPVENGNKSAPEYNPVKIEEIVKTQRGRFVNSQKISLWEKYALKKKDLPKIIDKNPKIIINILVKLFITIGIPGLTFILGLVGKIKEKIENTPAFIIGLLSILYFSVIQLGGQKLKNAEQRIESEIGLYRNMGYPIIFYNGSGKTKTWMKNYIHKYINRAWKENCEQPVFYIGAAKDDSIDKAIHNFYFPAGHPEWGLICVCQLVRDLADDSWGAIWPGTVVIDELEIASELSPACEAGKEQNPSHSELKIFKMPNDEKRLRSEIQEKKAWHFARDPSRGDPNCKDQLSRWFPLGDSVYAVRKNICWSDFLEELFALKDLLGEITIFKNPVCREFWLIQVDENECRLIDRLAAVWKMPTWENQLWQETWYSIFQLLSGSSDPKYNTWCESVFNTKKPKYWLSYTDWKVQRENNRTEKPDRNQNFQKEITKTLK